MIIQHARGAPRHGSGGEYVSRTSAAQKLPLKISEPSAPAEAVGALVEGEASEETNEKKALLSAADHVSKALANTSAVARSSYIHPNVFKAFESRKLKSSLPKNRLVQGLSRFESALLRLLRSNAG
jgi:hypothetical protein